MGVYEPMEDSYLLTAAVEKYAFGNVLDMGTGSGIQAITAARKDEVKSVVAADISDEALKYAAAAAEKEKVAKKITFVKSNLFSNIQGKFDTIIFNPPYLPQDKVMVDETIYGGKHGYEILQRFIGSCSSHLNDDGIILFVFSSRTNKQKVDEAIESSCLEFEELEQQHIFFETLYCYRIKKSQLLLQLRRNGIENVKLFEKGNRGLLYKCGYMGKTVVVKAKRKESKAIAAIENEINWLGNLNQVGIGPKLLLSSKEKDWFACEFVEGQFILDFIGSCTETNEIKAAMKSLLLQCRELDELKVNKEEMLRPQKHVLVGNTGKITMLDFERCRKALRPKNVTQLCQFLSGAHASSLLRQKGIIIDGDKLLAAAQKYKNSQSGKSFKRIEACIRD